MSKKQATKNKNGTIAQNRKARHEYFLEDRYEAGLALQQQRLRQAQTLIARGLMLSESAFACGFADQSHLNRHFVRCLGFTPGQWQRACRGPLQ